MLHLRRTLVATVFVVLVSLQAWADVKVQVAPSPAHPGDSVTCTATVDPNASCTIVVRYKSGKSGAKGLEPKTADAKGAVSWTWKVGRKTAAGSWPVTVTETSGGKAVSGTAQLQVLAAAPKAKPSTSPTK